MQRAEYYKNQRDLEGQGDANYASQFAEGQQKLYEALAKVIGPDNFARLEMLKQLEKMKVTNITPFFYYNGAPGGSETMPLLQGTILGGSMFGSQMGEAAKRFGMSPEDFMPAIDTSSKKSDSTDVPTVPIPAQAEPKPDSSKSE